MGGPNEKRKRSRRLRKEKKKEEGEQDEWTEEAFFDVSPSLFLSLLSSRTALGPEGSPLPMAAAATTRSGES